MDTASASYVIGLLVGGLVFSFVFASVIVWMIAKAWKKRASKTWVFIITTFLFLTEIWVGLDHNPTMTTASVSVPTQTSAATTSVATVSAGRFTIPVPDNATEVQVLPQFVGGLKTTMRSKLTAVDKGTSDLDIHTYASDDTPDTTISKIADSATSSGYTSRHTANKYQDINALYYTKSGTPDLFYMVGAPNKVFGLGGVQLDLGDVKNKKTLILVMSATGMYEALNSVN